VGVVKKNRKKLKKSEKRGLQGEWFSTITPLTNGAELFQTIRNCRDANKHLGAWFFLSHKTWRKVLK